MKLNGLYNMNKRRIIGEGFAVEAHGCASLAGIWRETHGRASLRAMPAGKTRGGMFLRAMPAGKACGGMFLLIALLLLFGACEKDMEGRLGDGKKVEIFFSTDIKGYNTAADLVRSGGLREAESRTMYINDSLYLQTTLVPDPDEKLRAQVGFIDEQKIRFEAYDVSSPSSPVDSKLYSYSMDKGKFIPDTDPLGVVPDGTTTYRFVAYSYFGEKNVPLTTINLSKDLVWGKSADGTVNDTELSRTVSINMTHQFAKVKVRVESGIDGVTIDALSGVEIVGGNWTTFDPFDGSFGTVGSMPQAIDFVTEDVLPAAEIESGQRLVFPVGTAPTKVKFGTIAISGLAGFSNQTVSFQSTLDGGTSYNLIVGVRRCVWARSNIYWDATLNNGEGALTFVPAGNDLTKQGYQGVFFKWGSLVGVSPAQTEVPETPGTMTNLFLPSTRIYVPIVNTSTLTNSTWKATTGSAVKTDIPGAEYNWTTWGRDTYYDTDIPYLDVGSHYNIPGTVAFGPSNRYAIDPDRNTPAMYASFRGDICQYLSTKTEVVSGDYRLPMASEIPLPEWGYGAVNGWTMGGNGTEDNTLGNDAGTVDLLDAANIRFWARNYALGNVVFPGSGSRQDRDGAIIQLVSRGGYYWTGSTHTFDAYGVFLSRNEQYIYVGFQRSWGMSIRCVQNLD
jgi:hypothetical protein